jgi:hypothetical protein
MIVTLKDRTEIYITKEQGSKLEQALLSGNTPEFIKLDTITFRTEWIVKLEHGGIPPKIETTLLEEPKADSSKTKAIREFIKAHIKSDPDKLKDNNYRKEWVENYVNKTQT